MTYPMFQVQQFDDSFSISLKSNQSNNLVNVYAFKEAGKRVRFSRNLDCLLSTGKKVLRRVRSIVLLVVGNNFLLCNIKEPNQD